MIVSVVVSVVFDGLSVVVSVVYEEVSVVATGVSVVAIAVSVVLLVRFTKDRQVSILSGLFFSSTVGMLQPLSFQPFAITSAPVPPFSPMPKNTNIF